MTPSAELIEALAKEIYKSMRFLRHDETPEWVEDGNAHAQDEARRCATKVCWMIQQDRPG